MAPNQFKAPVSEDLCEFRVYNDGASVQINNLVKKICSSLTYDEVVEAVRKYPEPTGWCRVLPQMKTPK